MAQKENTTKFEENELRKVIIPKPKAILMKILGVTTSWNFATCTLMQYFRDELDSFLKYSSNQPRIDVKLKNILKKLKTESIKKNLENNACPRIRGSFKNLALFKQTCLEYINWYLTENNLETDTPLNQLQSLVWTRAFKNGSIKTHFFEDVFPSLNKWRKAGIKLYTMSSGSVSSELAYFKCSTSGDKSKLIDGFIGCKSLGDKYDTKCYTRIADIINENKKQILFFTGNVKEAKAASISGMNVIFVTRPNNPQVSEEQLKTFHVIESFEQIEFK